MTNLVQPDGPPPAPTATATEWLAEQDAERRASFQRQLAYTARLGALKRERADELAAETARVRARQCRDCFLVKTPAGTCDCTEG